MPFDYSELVAVAQELINDFGRPVTLVRPGLVEPDPTKPWIPNTDIAPDLVVTAAIVNFDKNLIADGAVQQDDKRVLIAAADVPGETITPDWEIVDGASTYRVINPNEIAPGDTVIMWDIQARR